MEKMLDPFDPKGMDDEAEKAKKELLKIDLTTVLPVANWFAKHFGKAGHKRLGRVLVEISKSSTGK